MSKTIVVTGAASTYGRPIIHTLADEGHGVIAIIDPVNDSNADAARELRQTHNVEVVEVDISNDESVIAGFSFILRRYGHVDVLVNNECAVALGLAGDTTTQCYLDIFNSNVCGVLRAFKAVLPTMRKNENGLLINVYSGIAFYAAPFVSAVSVAEAGLEMLTEGILHEVRDAGIEGVSLWTGFYPTEFLDEKERSRGCSVQSEMAEELSEMQSCLIERNKNIKRHTQSVALLISELVNMRAGTRPSRYCLNPALKEAEAHYVRAKSLAAGGWQETYGLDI